jgi:NADH-quinone oxidoreductase subunit G
MTSRDFRFKQRSWFLTKSPSICHGCSKGCNIFIDHNREKYKDNIIYRFRPRFNEKVNGYFMCDEGRMTYKLENDNRLNVAQVTGRDSGFNEAVETVRRAMSQAQKTVMLVSPNASLEQLFTVQQLAVAMNATLTGYSDGYIKKDDGDDFLIKDDKSANRKAFALLGIDSSKAGFDAAINGADLLISFQNDLSRSLNEGEMTKVLETVKLISISSSLDASALKAAVALPIASYSEDTGSILNEDNMLQRYEKAVVKNTPAFDLIHVVHLLGGDIKNCHEARTGLSTTIAALKDVDLEQIPGEGLALTENEVANVAA